MTTVVLPELVPNILSSLYTDGPTLAACMRVNSLWAEEAANFLWREVGFMPGMIRGRLRPPGVRHLAALAAKPERLQWYASWVRYLSFAEEESYGRGYRPVRDDSRDENRFHSALIHTAFPRLRSVIFAGSTGNSRYKRSSLLLQYLQPALRIFSTPDADYRLQILSDDFFSAMQSRCPRLTQLDIGLCGEHSDKSTLVSSETFARCLQTMQCLEKLSLPVGFDHILNSEGFMYIAQYQRLVHLHLSDIPDFWIQDLVLENPEANFFPVINDLNAGVSDRGLGELLPHMRHVTNLELRPYGDSREMFRVIANAQLTDLVMVMLEFQMGSVVHGEDLVRLCKNAPMLEYLLLPMEYTGEVPEHFFHPVNITDTTIARMAFFVPHLVHLNLNPTREETELTEHSVMSLGAFCKELDVCHLSADAFFDPIIAHTPPNFFPTLTGISFHFPPDSTRRQYQNIAATAHAMRLRAPLLSTLGFYSNETEADQDLSNMVQELYVCPWTERSTPPPRD